MESRPLPEDDNALPLDETAETPTGDESATDGEFRLTVRKLQLPVRPRGVLAE
jgi:hypothetical protein